MPSTVVVVLAGGTSRRFGSDKLVADLDGRTLLDATLDSVPANLPVVVVGPERPVRRQVRFVREEPPGGGPAAALVAGLSAALADGVEAIATLPGDAPAAGLAVPLLVAALGPADVAVAQGPDGQVFPLQLACTQRGLEQIVAAAGPTAGSGASVRRLLQPLNPSYVLVEGAALLDVDVPADLGRYGLDPSA